ncbi:hypothetical protein Patl1_22523 [Pistacia atlantica]|uniref:Uncharacterized protein n=1 Tax=Pistacia atlantica TaxID=434234 RepID=A0ACC0ZXS1_9ROSI|nr:hypothetical protein Patl1_22523 [Pistacia atlantica]
MMSAYYLGIQIVTCSHFHLVFKNERLNFVASVFPTSPVSYITVSQDYHKPSDPDDLLVQIVEDHHESLQSDFRRSPDDLASRVSETDRQTLRHDQSPDFQGDDEDNKRSLIDDIICIGYHWERQACFHWGCIGLGGVCLFRNGDDKCYLPLVPLAFAGFRAFSAYSAFRKKHENGIHNAAEPPAENQVNQHENSIPNAAEPQVKNQVNQHENCIPNAAEPRAENQVNQHDGSRSIMAHMTVTGKPLNMVIDLTMVTCYEQPFRKLRDEMSQAEKVLWGDKSRWNVRYLDISGVTHGLHEDEISWDFHLNIAVNSAWLPGKYSSPEKKSVKIYTGDGNLCKNQRERIGKSFIYIGAVERTRVSRCCRGAADLEVLNRLMRWKMEKRPKTQLLPPLCFPQSVDITFITALSVFGDGGLRRCQDDTIHLDRNPPSSSSTTPPTKFSIEKSAETKFQRLISEYPDYHKPSDPDDLRVQIDEDHHGSLQSDFHRSPDDRASRVSEMDRQTLRHDQSPDFQVYI